MNTPGRVGIATSVLTFVAGVWIFLAPFIVGYQKVGKDWIDATRNDLWTGGALIAVSVLSLFLVAAFTLRDAALSAERRRSSEERAASDD